MKKGHVIKNNTVYKASIKNWNYSNIKIRPIIVIKQSEYKILAVQLTTSKPQPKELSEKLFNETNGKLKGIYLRTSHWIPKSKILQLLILNNESIAISKEMSKEILNELKAERKKKIKELRNKINQYLNIYVKTNEKKYINLCKSRLREWRHYDLNNSCPKKFDSWVDNKINIIKRNESKAKN